MDPLATENLGAIPLSFLNRVVGHVSDILVVALDRTSDSETVEKSVSELEDYQGLFDNLSEFHTPADDAASEWLHRLIEQCGNLINNGLELVRSRASTAANLRRQPQAQEELDRLRQFSDFLSQQQFLLDDVQKENLTRVFGISSLSVAAQMGLALVKFLLDSGVGVDSVDERGQTALQMAARNGDMQIVGFLLDNGAAVDLADLRRRRPLAFAVEGNHRAAVAVLLDRGADVNAMDNIGATPLAIALSEEQYADLIPLLLAKSPSPIVGVDVHVWNLISAAAEGDKTAVDNSLDEGVDVNARDGYGFTALYEASRFGHADIVIRLIAAGANPNEKVGLAGETALHGVVDRTNSFAGFLKQKLSHDEVRNQPSIRGTTPNLTEAHVQVTRCLLESGAVLNLKRWDGETVRNIVDKKLYCVPLQEQLDQDDKKILRDILEQLESPPAVGRYVGGAWRPSPPKLDAKKEEVCEYFKTRIQYHRMTTSRGCLRKDADERLVAARRNQSGPACSHDDCNKNTFKYRITPVLDFLYRRGDREANSEQKKIIELDTWAHAQDGPEWNHEHWRWIHLPANNKLWVKHTIRILHKFTTLKQSRMLDAFIDDSYDEYRGWAPHSRYRKATFTRLFGSRGDAFSLVIPYFDMERDAYLHRKVHLKDDHYRMKQQLEDAYLVGGKDPENLHLSCTLDQSYYLSLKDTSSRDHTQVVFRHTQRQEQEKMDTDARKAVRRRGGVEPRIQKTDAPVSGSGHPSRKKLLMVGHLWLWKLDANTVITAFPDRWDQGSEDDLAGHISRQLGQEPPNTLDETIVQIVYGAAGFVDGPTNAGLDENLFDIFEQSIATLADRQAKSYDTFEKLQQAMQKVVAGGPNAIGPGGKSVEDQISDISQEIQYLREIKDIRDELNMIERILEDQRRVTRMLLDAVNYKGRRKGWDDGWGEDLSQASEFRLSKIGKLHKQAKAVETSLNQLLDLKQKQGNLNEARDTRKLADEADARARAGEFQERVLFIFTVVTVIYTPISFSAALFAIPSMDFPANEWTVWQMSLGLIVTEIVTWLAVAGFAYWFFRRQRVPPKRSQAQVQMHWFDRLWESLWFWEKGEKSLSRSEMFRSDSKAPETLIGRRMPDLETGRQRNTWPIANRRR